MKRRLKVLSLVLAVVMGLALTGCAKETETSQVGDSNTNENSNTNEDGNTNIEAEEGEIVEITMAYMILNSAAPDMQKIEDAINEISEKEIGVHVNIEVLNIGDYDTQVNLMLSSNESLDIVQAFINSFSSWYANKSIIPFDNELQEYGQGIIEAVGEDYLEAGRINGEQYGITTNRDLATGYGYECRTDLLQKYNINPDDIKTLDDMEKVFDTIHENEPSIVPLTLNAEGSALFALQKQNVDPLGDYLGVLMDMTAEELKVENVFESEQYSDFVNRMHNWYTKGYIQSDAATSSEVGPTILRSGGAFAQPVVTKPGLATQGEKESGYPMTVIELYPANTCTSTVQTLQYAIANNSKNVGKAVEFLNLLYTNSDVANLLSWGIEGEHYVMTEDGHITFPEGIDATNSGYNLNQGWMLGNQFITHVWEGDELDVWTQMDEFNKNAIVSNAMGFTFNSDEVKTEYAACSAVLQQYRCSLECGVLDPDSALEELNNALYDAGLQKIMDEKQRQLDEWAAINK